MALSTNLIDYASITAQRLRSPVVGRLRSESEPACTVRAVLSEQAGTSVCGSKESAGRLFFRSNTSIPHRIQRHEYFSGVVRSRNRSRPRNRQETVNVYPDVVPQGSSGHPAGEMAGWGGMIISVVIGTVITLDKFGVLSRLGSSSNPAPAAIHTRLATMETRLAAVEQTVTSIDARDRADAAALARMEGQMSAWDARLLRIENAVVNRNNG
jgi:hypothetical protein